MNSNYVKQVINQFIQNTGVRYEEQKLLAAGYQARKTAFMIVRIVFAALAAVGTVCVLFFNLYWLTVFTLIASMITLVMISADKIPLYKDLADRIFRNADQLQQLLEKSQCLLWRLEDEKTENQSIYDEFVRLAAERDQLYTMLSCPTKSIIKKAAAKKQESAAVAPETISLTSAADEHEAASQSNAVAETYSIADALTKSNEKKTS